jgi:ABC-2 type transport system permease protein
MGHFAMYFSPLTYGNDLIQAAYHGHIHFNPLLNIAMLCIIILIFQILANRLSRRWNE